MTRDPAPPRPLILAAIWRLGLGVGLLMAVGGGAVLPDAVDDPGTGATGVVALTCGLGLAWAFYTAEREAQLDARTRRRHPGEPWRLLRGWRPGVPAPCADVPGTRLAVNALLLFSIAAAALTVVAFWQAATIQAHPADILWTRRLHAAKVASALMPFATAGLVAALFQMRRRLARLEGVKLSLGAVPILPGRELAGEVVSAGIETPVRLLVIAQRGPDELLRLESPLGPRTSAGRQAFRVPIPHGLPGSTDPELIDASTVRWRADAVCAPPSQAGDFSFQLPVASEAEGLPETAAFGGGAPPPTPPGARGAGSADLAAAAEEPPDRVWPALSPAFLATAAGLLAVASLAVRVGCSPR